jgi:hypothetical protein
LAHRMLGADVTSVDVVRTGAIDLREIRPR